MNCELCNEEIEGASVSEIIKTDKDGKLDSSGVHSKCIENRIEGHSSYLDEFLEKVKDFNGCIVEVELESFNEPMFFIKNNSRDKSTIEQFKDKIMRRGIIDFLDNPQTPPLIRPEVRADNEIVDDLLKKVKTGNINFKYLLVNKNE